jgi:uncharacterized OsmC-like protein
VVGYSERAPDVIEEGMAGGKRRRAMSGKKVVNGVRVDALKKSIEVLKRKPKLGKCVFRASNRWIDCALNRSTIKGYYAVGKEFRHKRPFVLASDEGPVLVGKDTAPGPVEYLLTALASCLTTSLVYQAALHGIRIRSVESKLEGDLDIRGFLSVSSAVRKGFQNIRVTFKVKTDASKKELEKLARFSPVFDVVSNGTNVKLKIQTV